MDIRVLSQLAGGTTSPAAAVTVPVDTRVLISEIAASAALSNSEKGGLIAAAASVDSALVGGERSSALEQIQRLGIYLRNSGSEGFPRWPMMTALRAYGMNLSSESGNHSAVVANMRGQLEQIAQGRGVTLEKAVAAAVSLPVPQFTRAVLPADAPVADTPDVGMLVEAIA